MLNKTREKLEGKSRGLRKENPGNYQKYISEEHLRRRKNVRDGSKSKSRPVPRRQPLIALR